MNCAVDNATASEALRAAIEGHPLGAENARIFRFDASTSFLEAVTVVAGCDDIATIGQSIQQCRGHF